MPLDFAAAEARLGASILSAMSNATLTLPDGVTVVEGMLRNRGREAAVGIGMHVNEVEFDCSLDDADALAEAESVTVTYRDVETAYLVAERLPDDIHLGHAAFALRRAAE